jgi:hypothetical protein
VPSVYHSDWLIDSDPSRDTVHASEAEARAMLELIEDRTRDSESEGVSCNIEAESAETLEEFVREHAYWWDLDEEGPATDEAIAATVARIRAAAAEQEAAPA